MRNDNPDEERAVLTVWLEDAPGKKVKSVCQTPVTIKKGTEAVIAKAVALTDLAEGKYVLVSSLSGTNNKVCDQERDQIRIIPPFVSPLQRDNNYLYFPWKYYMPWKQNPQDFASFKQEVEQIIDEMGFYSHGILFFPGYYDVGHEMDDRELSKCFAMLRRFEGALRRQLFSSERARISSIHVRNIDRQRQTDGRPGRAFRRADISVGLDLPEPENSVLIAF